VGFALWVRLRDRVGARAAGVGWVMKDGERLEILRLEWDTMDILDNKKKKLLINEGWKYWNYLISRMMREIREKLIRRLSIRRNQRGGFQWLTVHRLWDQFIWRNRSSQTDKVKSQIVFDITGAHIIRTDQDDIEEGRAAPPRTKTRSKPLTIVKSG
jgi:hypothetical protein